MKGLTDCVRPAANGRDIGRKVSENNSRFGLARPPARTQPPPCVPGIIDGSMTIHSDPGGGLSFRVIISAVGRPDEKHDLLELIVDARHIEHIWQACAEQRNEMTGGPESPPAIPCHVGFSRGGTIAAA